MTDAWERDNGLDPYFNDALLDPDEDGFCNLREFLSGTDPWNGLHVPTSCLADFDDIKDQDSDGADLAHLAEELGREDCTPQDLCHCDLDNNGCVDRTDLFLLMEDFGRIY
jgi:hypothetical protein